MEPCAAPEVTSTVRAAWDFPRYISSKLGGVVIEDVEKNILVVASHEILQYSPTRDPHQHGLRRENYVADRTPLPGTPEGRYVTLVQNDKPEDFGSCGIIPTRKPHGKRYIS
ncbi:hypothetical protein J6590_075823 [Homalodisca vitripennis]|nr:hypothetical protein J6590_075823 [Homalodisca vitripennis]